MIHKGGGNVGTIILINVAAIVAGGLEMADEWLHRMQQAHRVKVRRSTANRMFIRKRCHK